LGYAIAPPGVTGGIRKVHDFLTVGAPAPLQEAGAEALAFPDTYYTQLQVDYTARRDLFLGYLEQSGLHFYRPQGAYYVLVDISPFGYASDTEFCVRMAQEIGVAAVPGSSFFHEPVNHLIRLNYAKREETLIEAGERLLLMRQKMS
jgi:aminotransferase